MALVRQGCAVALSLTLWAAVAQAEDQAPAAPTGLYDRPVLVVDPAMHNAAIWRAAADREGRWAVTGSEDKTLRVWSLADGTLLRVIRLPAGPGNVGKALAVAISPDGTVIAAGGWTRSDSDEQERIYLFDRDTGALMRRIEGLPSAPRHLTFSPANRLGGVCARPKLPRRKLRRGLRPRRTACHHVPRRQGPALRRRSSRQHRAHEDH
jgi:WD domain, G-beta repeat